jgi:hypothetical protein
MGSLCGWNSLLFWPLLDVGLVLASCTLWCLLPFNTPFVVFNKLVLLLIKKTTFRRGVGCRFGG